MKYHGRRGRLRVPVVEHRRVSMVEPKEILQFPLREILKEQKDY